MPKDNIVIGQNISRAKLDQARQLRRSLTPAERRLWAELRRNRLAGVHFRRQQIIDRFIVDFYCHAAGLVVEMDGPVHELQAEYDAGRDCALASCGLQVLRVSNDAVIHNTQRVLARIRDACRTALDALSDCRSVQPTGHRSTSAPRVRERSQTPLLAAPALLRYNGCPGSSVSHHETYLREGKICSSSMCTCTSSRTRWMSSRRPRSRMPGTA